MPDAHMLHVICHRPGLHRGGRVNPAHACYQPGTFTLAQLQQLDNEPEITLILGLVPDAKELAAEAAEVIAAKAAEAKKTKGEKS